MTHSNCPTATELDRPSSVYRGSRSIFSLLWFLPGTIIGFQLGSVIDLGIAATIHRITVAPLRALTFFGGFSVCCFVCTCLWRMPRRYLVGGYHATAIAAFSSGTVLACGFYLTVEGLENLGPLRATGSPSVAQWCVFAAIGLGLAVAAVEFEAVLTRLTSWKIQPNTRRFRFSIRSLLCLVAGVACVLAFLRSFGLHLLWLPYHFESARTALTEVECLSPNRDELFAQCAFGGIVFEIPESMAKNISIGRSGSDVWIRFADATRMVGIEFPRHKDTATYLMPIPDGMDDWSLPRLWKEMCDCSSDNFSWKQSREDLRRLQWAIMGRRELGLDRNNFTRYSFEANRGCEWILLSCDPAAVDHKTRLRSWMIWETQNANAGGEIHFGDAARQKVAWIDVFARSFQITSLPATGNSVIDIADKTSSEILSMISIDHGSGENESR